MTKFVCYVPDEVIEENTQFLLADYARARGVAIEPPIPIDDIIEKYLKIGIEFDDTHRLFDMPRSGIGSEPDILGAIFFDQRRIVIDESLDPDANPAKEGRYRYTAAHEVGHWRLHRTLFVRASSVTSVLCVGQEEKEANENEASARALEDTAVWYEGEYEKAEMKWVKAHIAANEYVCSGGLANMPFEECVEFDGEVTGKYEHTADNEEVNENYARQTNQADEAFKTEVRTAWQAQWDRLSPEAKFHFESKHEGPASKPSHISGKGGLSFSVVPMEKLRPMEELKEHMEKELEKSKPTSN